MEIYEQIRADREEGARRLVGEYRTRLQAAAMLLCGNAHTAEDLVFRAFEKAINRIDDFRPTGSFYYWIYTILLNFWRMDQRKRSVRQELMPKDELPETADTRPDPYQQMLFAGTAEAVRSAVQKLPDEFREVVVLRYFEELSTPEIARIVGVPEGTVRSRLHYAREALDAMLSSTELSPDFTERLIRATRARRSWFARSRFIASLAVAFALGAVAFASAVVVAAVGGGGRAARPVAVSADAAGLWKVASAVAAAPLEDEIDKSIERGLKFILSQQRSDGSFPGQFGDSAAVSALAGMAMLSKGHLPTDDTYGPALLKCLDYVLSTADMSETAAFRGYMGQRGNGRMYAHSIATLFLAEMSGMVDDGRQARLDRVLALAVRVILDAQNQRKDATHVGGWRYQPNSNDSDLSCSGWALMALRSAKMNGAAVPQEAIEKAVLYIKRRQRQTDGAFSYMYAEGQFGETLSGAAILCLELCGRHLDPTALKAQAYVRGCYKRVLPANGNTFYALYYTAQGLFQLGGETWKEFQDWMYATWLKRQGQDGSWRGQGDQGCPAYATAMMVLSFAVPYRMLPIYQRDETVDPEDDEEAETKGKDKENRQ